MKTCKRCKINKDDSNFGRSKTSKDGLRGNCRECYRELAAIYRSNNRDVVNKRSILHYHNNKEKRKEYESNNKEVLKEKKRIYYIENKERIQEYRRLNKWNRNLKRRQITNKLYRIKNSIRTSIGRSIRNKGYTKSFRTQEILGCSFEEFYSYLESKFESWMNWENYGKYNGEFNYGWDIDHVIPLTESNSENDLVRLNHYTNLQPLCSKVNRDIKKDRRL